MCGFLALALLPAASLSENGFFDSCKSRDTPEGSNYAETRKRKIASMCSKEKNGPSCAKAEAEEKKVIKRITDLIEVPSVNVVSRFLRQNRWKGFS
jgi:hypothetical protein